MKLCFTLYTNDKMYLLVVSYVDLPSAFKRKQKEKKGKIKNADLIYGVNRDISAEKCLGGIFTSFRSLYGKVRIL